ncbi:MAG: hypothetical protein AMXMBFR7_47940 [Planctomycetota bacterium]
MSEITKKWESLGGKSGFLGDAVAEEKSCPDGVGRYREFQHGHIYWHENAGAYEVHGAIRDKWGERGWEKGNLGYPISDEEGVAQGKGRRSNFQGGTITWDPEKNACEVEEFQNQYAKHYTKDDFWAKVSAYAMQAGRQVLETALILYYVLMDSDTPAWASSLIIGSLGYFIFPVDIIADVIPGFGYTDDLGVLCATLAIVASHIKEKHKQDAAIKIKEYF